MKRFVENIHPYIWIALAGILIWGVTLTFGFVWDDFPMIANNASLHSWKTLATGWAHDFWELHDIPQPSGYWRPIATMVHVILFHIGGGKAIYFHLFNVLLHICNAIFFYQFLINAKLLKWSWIPVLFFLVHPLSAETVSFNSAIPDLLSAFFGLASLVLWTGKNKRDLSQRILAFACLCLSFLSKESGVFFGFFLIGFDFLKNADLAAYRKMFNDTIVVCLTTIYVFFSQCGHPWFRNSESALGRRYQSSLGNRL